MSPSKRKKAELICPCCGVTRGQQAKRYLLDIERKCDLSNSIDLAKLAKLYFEINSYEKGSSFLKQAVNTVKRNNQEDELEVFLADNDLKLPI